MQETKPYSISKRAVIAASGKTKANIETYGVAGWSCCIND